MKKIEKNKRAKSNPKKNEIFTHSQKIINMVKTNLNKVYENIKIIENKTRNKSKENKERSISKRRIRKLHLQKKFDIDDYCFKFSEKIIDLNYETTSKNDFSKTYEENFQKSTKNIQLKKKSLKNYESLDKKSIKKLKKKNINNITKNKKKKIKINKKEKNKNAQKLYNLHTFKSEKQFLLKRGQTSNYLFLNKNSKNKIETRNIKSKTSLSPERKKKILFADFKKKIKNIAKKRDSFKKNKKPYFLNLNKVKRNQNFILLKKSSINSFEILSQNNTKRKKAKDKFRKIVKKIKKNNIDKKKFEKKQKINKFLKTKINGIKNKEKIRFKDFSKYSSKKILS